MTCSVIMKIKAQANFNKQDSATDLYNVRKHPKMHAQQNQTAFQLLQFNIAFTKWTNLFVL